VSVETIIRRAAIVLGVVVIAVPLGRVVLSGDRAVTLTVGSGSRGRRWPAAVLTTIALVSIGVLLWRPLPVTLTPAVGVTLGIVGALLYAPGVGLYLWGFAAIGSRFAVSSVSGADLPARHELVTSGPFRWSRHPMYLGVLLAAAGALLIFRTWAMVLFAPMSLVVIRRAHHEERLLADAYGERWQEYARRVPKWLPRWS
jgi:protein-S-isoprenylcysteine O-methyltransferase Ste14